MHICRILGEPYWRLLFIDSFDLQRLPPSLKIKITEYEKQSALEINAQSYDKFLIEEVCPHIKS